MVPLLGTTQGIKEASAVPKSRWLDKLADPSLLIEKHDLSQKVRILRCEGGSLPARFLTLRFTVLLWELGVGSG